MDRKDNKSEKKSSGLSGALGFIRKWRDGLCDNRGCQYGGVDSHRWGNKIEAFGSLKSPR